MGRWSLPFYSPPFSRYVFLQGLLCANLALLCISSMTDPDAEHTMHNRAVACNPKLSQANCTAASKALGKLRIREIIIWTQHLTLGVLSCFSGAICILAWAAQAKTWERLEGQRVVYWCAPFVGCLILLVHVFLALFHNLYIRSVYLWFSVMASALVLWDGFHFAASLQELLPEPTQSSETPPSKRTPIDNHESLRLTAKPTVTPKTPLPAKPVVSPTPAVAAAAPVLSPTPTVAPSIPAVAPV